LSRDRFYTLRVVRVYLIISFYKLFVRMVIISSDFSLRICILVVLVEIRKLELKIYSQPSISVIIKMIISYLRFIIIT